MKYAFFSLFGLIFFVFPAVAFASDGVQVQISDESGEVVTQFYPFGEDYRGTGSLASGDLGEDGVPEIIVGSGPGLEPLIKVYRQDGSLINEFYAYAETYKNGTTVAVCDLNNDGQNEIVTGTKNGGGPHVRMFTSEGHILYGGGFFAYDGDFRGGVNVACGDVDGDGFDDIVTGPGITGGPHVKVFDPLGNLKYETFAGSASEDTGATVAVADANGDGDSEIIAGRMGVGDPTVILFDLKLDRLSFVLAVKAFEDYENGILVTGGDVDGDGMDEIGVSTNRHEKGIVRFFEMTGLATTSIEPFDTEAEKGIVPATIPNGEHDLLLSMSSSPQTSDQVGKYIKVDISEQTLYAYENGALVHSFLVSTGTYYFPTPLGKTTVTAKLLWHDYAWSYGVGNPNNYNLPGVKYNLRFRPHYYIHSAYWHNNFGHRMSHGCINVPMDEAAWIFDWAYVGTVVEVVP